MINPQPYILNPRPENPGEEVIAKCFTGCKFVLNGAGPLLCLLGLAGAFGTLNPGLGFRL